MLFSPLVWHEELVSWPSKRWSLRRRTVFRRFHFLGRWGLILLCRLGLRVASPLRGMTALLLWSGWPQRQFFSWALSSLPVVDAVLFLLPLYRLCQAILDIWVPNFWLSAQEVRERLLAEGRIAQVKDVSVNSIYQVARDSSFAEVRRLSRQSFTFTADGPRLVNRRFDQHYQNMCGFDTAGSGTPQHRNGTHLPELV